LKCKSKLDVILLLDGSGSVRDSGWAATLQFAEKMLGGFQGQDVMVSVILFSGPSTWGEYYQCERGGMTTADYTKKCRVEMVQHFTNDIPATITKVKALKFPKMSTYLAAALAMAKAELKLGRADAKKTVLVMTDGVPISPAKSGAVAKEIRAKARLMFGAIKLRRRGLNYVRRWATKPANANVMKINTYRQLDKVATMNGLMRDLCSDVARP